MPDCQDCFPEKFQCVDAKLCALAPAEPGSRSLGTRFGDRVKLVTKILLNPPLVASLLLVVRPGAPSSVLAPSSKARSH